MEQNEVIKSILSATNYTQVFTDLKNWQPTYKSYAKLIHPDVCKLEDTTEAISKLNKFKDEVSIGQKYIDDAGTVTYKPFSIIAVGDPTLLKTSLDNWKKLMSFTDDASKHFQKYLPEKGKLISENELEFTFFDRAIPLFSIGTQPHEHVNWITNRMLEFACWLAEKDFVHCGLTPESVYIIPENHGAVITSFYHMKKINTAVKTISAKFKNFYPSSLFLAPKTTIKTASSRIDIELLKKTSVYVLGDKSGSGVKLRKTHNVELLDYFKKSSNNTHESYAEHKAVVIKHFETKFHILNK